MSRPMKGSSGRIEPNWYHESPRAIIAGMVILRSMLLTHAGFAHGFSLRDATDADLFRALAVGAISQVKQVHGARAVEARQAEGAEADAIVARDQTTAV